MDQSMHQLIALERRDRWLRAAAAARSANSAHAPRRDRRAEPLTPSPAVPSTMLESLLAPIPVPRLLWPHHGRAADRRAPRSAEGQEAARR